MIRETRRSPTGAPSGPHPREVALSGYGRGESFLDVVLAGALSVLCIIIYGLLFLILAR